MLISVLPASPLAAADIRSFFTPSPQIYFYNIVPHFLRQ